MTLVVTIFIILLEQVTCGFIYDHGDCDTYQSCSNDKINGTTSSTDHILCGGAQSCDNSFIKSSDAYVDCCGYGTCCNSTTQGNSKYIQHCNGYGSCMQSTVSSFGSISCDGQSSCSGSNVKVASVECRALHSCANTVITSLTWDVNIYLEAPFCSYNTTVYSNGKNVYISTSGYYSGYGVTLYCNGKLDACIIDCYNDNNCGGLAINCSGEKANCIKCIDNQCTQIPAGNVNESESKVDEIVYLIDNILKLYHLNYGILPTKNSLKFNDWINTDGYCKNTKYVFVNSYSETRNNSNKNNYNDNICCLANNSCSNMRFIGRNINTDNPVQICIVVLKMHA